MTRAVQANGLLFSKPDEVAFELPLNPGVTVRPLLTKDQGRTIDVFFLTLDEGSRIERESHPYSETLIVLDGTLACTIDDQDDEVDVGAGELIHIAADAWHQVRNVGPGRLEITMLIGV